MKLIDANVLIYAAHSEAVKHLPCLAWLKDLYQSGEAYAQTDLTAAAFLRITTSPSAWNDPLTIQEALQAYDDIRSRAQCRWLNASATHWSIFSELCRSSVTNANLVNDAWLAALTIENDCDLISTDGDFAKFPGLRWHNPLAAT